MKSIKTGRSKIIPWYVPDCRELVELVRVWAMDVGDGERCRELKRPCFFSGKGAGSSMTCSSGLRLEKNGIFGVGLGSLGTNVLLYVSAV